MVYINDKFIFINKNDIQSKIIFLYLINRNDKNNVFKFLEISCKKSRSNYFEIFNDKQVCIRGEYERKTETTQFRVHSYGGNSFDEIDDEIVYENFRGSNLRKIYLRSTNQDFFFTRNYVFDYGYEIRDNYLRYYAY